MGRQTLVAVLAASVLGAGCGERAEPLGDLPQTYPVVVRGAGERPVVAERPPRRIVALDPGSAELIAALGSADKLVGVPAGVRGTRATEVVSRTGQVKVDAVVALEPDLIVATGGTDPLDLARAARESDAVAYVQPSTSVGEVQRGAIELGFLLGTAPEARRLVADIRREISEIESVVAAERVVPVFIDTGFLITVSERSLAGDLVRRARGRSVAGPTPGPDPFDPCKVVRLGAEAVLVLAEARQRTPPREFATCPQGRGVRSEVVPPRLLRPGPRLPDALEAIARALRPDAVR